MNVVEALTALESAMDGELRGHILPYWMNKMTDPVHGGFYGRITGDDQVDANAPKGAILNGRILWTFAAAYRTYGLEAYKKMADRAVRYMERHFWDPEFGGMYWMLDHEGLPLDAKKHSYAQAFAIYGYSEHHRATGAPESLTRAVELFHLLDRHAWIEGERAYYEAFDRGWKRLEDVRLSDIDADQTRSTNTHLHILEAFAGLYRVWPDPALRDRLSALVDVFHDTIFDAETHSFHAFFDDRWTPMSPTYSYGHDIETSWLLSDALCALGDDSDRYRQQLQLVRQVADYVMQEGMDPESGGLYNAGKGGSVSDTDHHWWAQAEALVGFVNAYQTTGDEKYVHAALKTWDFIRTTVIDPVHGEWFFRVNNDGRPYHDEDKAGPWKCPYHTSRACMEIRRRVATVRSQEDLAFRSAEITSQSRPVD